MVGSYSANNNGNAIGRNNSMVQVQQDIMPEYIQEKRDLNSKSISHEGLPSNMNASLRAIGVKSGTNRTFQFLLNSNCSRMNNQLNKQVARQPGSNNNSNQDAYFMSRLWRGINCTGGEYHQADGLQQPPPEEQPSSCQIF